MDKYNHQKIDKKWQAYWEKNKLFDAIDFDKKPKQYILVEFPYPSGEGLHTGHCRSYTALDTIARKRRMEGFNVLYPIGWDAFGLPTENYAIKTGIHPAVATKKNTDTFRRQLKSLGYSFDWSREINTTDPKYYKWTQWIFLQLYKKGLAYKAKMPINFCPSCKIGLANEEVIAGKCERCGTEVTKKEMEQWMLAITKYADRLIDDLDKVDYLEKIKQQQINWIGRSEGAEIIFKVRNTNEAIKVFTTRPDTLFGATYMVLSPEHKLIQNLKTKIENFTQVDKYINEARRKSDIERTDEKKDKTGVELKGIKAINAINNAEIPIFVADYVLPNYGTGAIMAVPAHDQRDFEFAKKFDLPIKQVIAPFYTAGKGKDAVRNNKKTVKRKMICAIVKHWKEDKIYCLNWEKFNWHSFILGGVDKQETGAEAAKREVVEETGYQNIKSVKKIGFETHSNFFAHHKDVNRYSMAECYVVELADDNYKQSSKEHTENHKGVWVKSDKVEDFINLSNNLYYWEIYKKGEKSFSDYGILINSSNFDHLSSKKGGEKIAEKLKKLHAGNFAVNYKLRDWIFSRQHYWGEPIPIVYCQKCGEVAVPEKDLPVELPMVEKYQPTETGESPLANIKDWVNTKCPKCGGPAKRETDTMPNWAGSSWYYLRYLDPHNDKVLADRKKMDYWMPVDLYNGGMEHTTLHLLYSRFWYKFLFDIGVVPTDEPYKRRTSHGIVLAEGGIKMSKSKGNVINPDVVVKAHGADVLRLYEMFMGPFGQRIAWDTKGILGVRRFLDKVWKLFKSENKNPLSNQLKIKLNQTIKKVTDDIENFGFNTAVSALMEFINHALSEKVNPKKIESFCVILSPFAPHLSEEIWQMMSHKESILKEKWPKVDAKYLTEEEMTIAIQVNGKLRDTIKIKKGTAEKEIIEAAKSSPNTKKYLVNGKIKKEIYIKDRLVNFVI